MTVEEINAKVGDGAHPTWKRPIDDRYYAEDGIEIGDYLLRYFRSHDGNENYWIEHESGQGLEVSRESLIKCIEKFYEENF